MKGKGNDGIGNIKDRDDWETPQWLFDLLNEEYKFDLDCCATEENKKTKEYIKDFKSPCNFTYNKICWMNPPFSKAKEMFEIFFNEVNKGIAIYRCDNLETRIWQDIILKEADWIFIPKGRISYCYNEKLRNGKGSRFPSALIGIGVKPLTILTGKLILLKENG